MSKPITGHEAEELNRKLASEAEAQRAAQLATRRLEAALREKEPFSLDTLELYIDLSWQSEQTRTVTREEKSAYYEFRYYVTFPDVQTIEDFAAIVTELRQWNSE